MLPILVTPGSPSGIDTTRFQTVYKLNHYHKPSQPAKGHTCSCTVCSAGQVVMVNGQTHELNVCKEVLCPWLEHDRRAQSHTDKDAIYVFVCSIFMIICISK